MQRQLCAFCLIKMPETKWLSGGRRLPDLRKAAKLMKASLPCALPAWCCTTEPQLVCLRCAAARLLGAPKLIDEITVKALSKGLLSLVIHQVSLL